MKTISRYIMTLALLLTAVTGAWAEETLLTTINASSDFQSGSKTFDGVAIVTITGDIAYDYMPGYGWSAKYSSPGGSVSVEPADGITISSCKFYFNNNNTYTISTAPFVLYPNTSGSSYTIYTGPNSTGEQLYGSGGIKKIEVYGAAEPPIEVTPVAEPAANTKQWTFKMPGSDVVLTPIYAKAAAFATTGTGSEAKTLLPEAAEGVIAGTDASLIAEGTGIVANIGETTTAQGTLMYAIGTSDTQAPELTAFSATVPTAENVADDGADVYVWYYIQGADAPTGEAATLDNTFDNTEPACLTVQVLTNKFDITLNAANANTIEAGKATVTVDDQPATVTDGKLQGVKMGSEVKLEAKPGYKFRKVEVKKGAEAPAYPLLSASTAEDIGKVVCAAGHLHDAKTAVPDGCTAVGILGKVTETGHGLILALQNATAQTWNTINGWTSVTTYASTTLKVLPDDAARGTNLTSYTTLGETAVSNWAVAQKSDYEAIFTNLGSTKSDSDGTTYDGNVNAYITTGVGGAAISGYNWSATEDDDDYAWYFSSGCWYGLGKSSSRSVRPVLGF